MDDDLAEALRARRVDLETADEARMRKCKDQEHLAYATAQGRVVYTYNTRHFCALHAEVLTRGQSHAGIVVCQQQRYSVGEQMRRLLNLIAAKTAEEMRDQLEFLSDWA
jgi:hypothetical protein